MVSTGELTLEVMKSASWYNNWLFSFMEPFCKGEILEIGAGIGNFTELLMQKGSVTATDYEQKYIKALKKKYKNRITVRFADIERGKYSFGRKKFDTIICLNVLEHIEKDKEALKNMYSLLNKKGNLILLVPAHQTLYSLFDKNLGHFRRYNNIEVQKLLTGTGFDSVNGRYLNWFGAFGWFIFLKIMVNGQLPRGELKIFNYLGRFLLWPEKILKLPFGLSVFAVAAK